MTTPDLRRKIKVTGKESLRDVARIVFKDPRLATLIADLNPSLPASGLIAANAVVTCPSKAEAMAFAKKMGFTLGFDEKGTNGTRQKRAWAKLQGPGQASHAGIDPADAAKKLLEQKLAAPEVGKRLAKLCTPEALDAFLAQEVTADLKVVQQATRVHVDFPRARARLLGAVAVIEATLRPPGLMALLVAQVSDGTATQAVLSAVLAPVPAKAVIAAEAARVTGLVARAKELCALEPGARDASLAADAVAGPVLARLCAALTDRVPPVSGERLAALGLEQPWEALAAHLEKLRDMLKKHDDVLGRAGADVISTVATGADGGKLPKPWPLVAAVVRGLKEPFDAAPITARDLGLGGLVPTKASLAVVEPSGVTPRPVLSAEGAPLKGPVLSAASLQARAASGAKTVDEGTAIAERLAPVVCELIAIARPVVGDAGPTPMRRAKRKAHFDDVVFAKGAPQSDAIVRLVDDVVADARRAGLDAAQRLPKPQHQAAREVAKLLGDGITVHQRPASELARAIVVVACALDRDLGAQLSRPTGKEAFRGAVEKHAGKVLSKAGLVFTEPPKG